MSKFNLSLIVLLVLILPSGGTAIRLVNQPELTDAQTQILETSAKICYGASTTLFGLVATNRRLRNKKQPADRTNP